MPDAGGELVPRLFRVPRPVEQVRVHREGRRGVRVPELAGDCDRIKLEPDDE